MANNKLVTLDGISALWSKIKAGFASKTEFDALVKEVAKLDVSIYKIVETLPATGDPKCLYLVPKAESEKGNVYDEYVYIESTKKYEKIGPDGIKIAVDDALSETSENPVKNKVITKEVNDLKETAEDYNAAKESFLRLYNGGTLETSTDDVTLGQCIIGEGDEMYDEAVRIPSATTEKAGVMSAEDKETLESHIDAIKQLQDKVFPLSISVSGGSVYKKGTTQTVTVRWTVKEGDKVITPETVKVNGTEVTNTTTSKAFSGVTANTTYTVEVTNKGVKKSGSTSATFVNPKYFSVVPADFVANAANITGLAGKTEAVQNSKAYTTAAFTQTAQKNMYAYPKAFGALTSITDGKNEFINSYTRSEVTLNGEAYYVYLLNDASSVTNYSLQFK
ncbi:hypothetical protein E5358_04760 [Palleniella muris]|uniref:Uncharacterized protein n=1 Tax=Palleniella muris TaxID=3038145 RepID=A0AC61QRU3_9BACT|nr:hypothetical protein [Palleniella muris]TGX82975.1 hypothetical protein E5358_04760 [Palleniella muris]